VVTSANVSVGVASQASVAVGVANDGDAGHWIVLGPGSAEITGGVVSTTGVVLLQVLGHPLASVITRVRV
jgi:hypothetical protein